MKKFLSRYNKLIIFALSFVAAILLIFAVTPAFAFENLVTQQSQEDNPEISDSDLLAMQEWKKKDNEEQKKIKDQENPHEKNSTEAERESHEEIGLDQDGNLMSDGESDVENDEYANDVLGNYTLDGGVTWTNFSNESGFQKAIEDHPNCTVEVNLWKDVKLGSRLCIAHDETCTLHLHSHVIDRGKFNTYSNKGEIFKIDKNSHLIIIGSDPGDEILSRSLKGYSSVEDTEWSTETYNDIKGGVVCHGGDWDGGGGFHYSADNGYVKLVNTTVFGCLAFGYVGDGHGGGACFYNDNCTFEMVDSSIERTVSTNEGGVFFVDDDMRGNRVLMTNSHIKYCDCGDEGGVFCEWGGNSTISGDAVFGDITTGSTIEHNHADQEGGAIYLDVDDDTADTITGINFIKNHSPDGGGAVYLYDGSATISGCNFSDNTTSEDGGAVYDDDDLTIADCWICHNEADGDGAGVFVDYNDDINLSGTVICKDNYCDSGTEDDMYLNTWALSACAYINPSVTNASSIGLYRRNFNVDRYKRASLDPGGYNEYCFFSNNGSHRIECSRSDYHLWFKSGTEDKKNHEFKWESRTPSYSRTDKKYNDEPVYRGITSYSMMTYSEESMSTYYYYSDGYFKDEPEVYNPHLASCSMAFEISCSKQNEDLPDGSGNLDYSRKFTNLAQVFADIGCDQQNIYANDFYFVQPTADSIGCAMAYKSLDYDDEGTILVPIVVRGMGYESEWGSNAYLDGTGDHAGFRHAADIVVENVNEFIQINDLQDKVTEGKVKFWIMGHSRAGATSNLAAKQLTDKYCAYRGNKVFCYTFEPPYCTHLNTASGTKIPVEAVIADYTYYGEYKNIHNTLNACDPVVYIPHPYLHYDSIVFSRYGVSHFIPGEEGETVKEPFFNTEVFDNKKLQATWWNSDSQYVKDRDKMIGQLTGINQYHYYSDFCKSAELNTLTGALGLARMLEPAGNLKDMETLINDFMNKLFEEALNYSRAEYLNKHKVDGTEHPPFQTGLTDALRIFMGKNPREFNEMSKALSGILGDIGTFNAFKALFDLRFWKWEDCTQYTHRLRLEEITDGLFTKHQGPDLQDYLTAEEVATLKDDLFTVLDDVMYFASWTAWHDKYDIDDGGFPLLASLIFNVGRMFSNHYPEVSLAWVRAYDDYYDNLDDKLPIKLNTNYIPNPEKPKLLYDGEEKEDLATVDLTKSNTFQLFSNDNVILDGGVNHNGDVIYYNVEKTENPDDVADPTVTSQAKHYQSSLTLHRSSTSEEDVEHYVVKACSVSYGKFSDVSTFYINVHNGFQVKVYSADEESNAIEYKRIIYGNPVVLSTDEIHNSQRFSKWVVESSETGEDVTEEVFGDTNPSSENINTTWFSMLPEDLEVRPTYDTPKNSVINLIGDNVRPRLNMYMSDTSSVEYTINNKTFNNLDTVGLSWKAFDKDGNEITDWSKVEPYMSLQLDFNIPIDVEKGIYFGPSTTDTKIQINKEAIPDSDVHLDLDNVNNVLKVTCKFAPCITELYETHGWGNNPIMVQLLGTDINTIDDVKNSIPETINVLTLQDGEVEVPSSCVDWKLDSIVPSVVTDEYQQFTIEGELNASKCPDYLDTTYLHYNYVGLYLYKSAKDQLKYPETNVYPGEYFATSQNPLVVNLYTDQPNCKIYYILDGGQPEVYDPAEPFKFSNDSDSEDRLFDIVTWCVNEEEQKASPNYEWKYSMKHYDKTKENDVTLSHKNSQDEEIADDIPMIGLCESYITISAKNIDGYEFVKWVDKSTNPIIDEGETYDRIAKIYMYTYTQTQFSFEAIYAPIIQDIEVTMTPLVIGDSKSGKIDKATIITPTPTEYSNMDIKNYLDLSWVEENVGLSSSITPKYNAQYLAELTLDESFFDDDNNFGLPRFLNVKVIDKTDKTKYTSGYFVYNKEESSYVSSVVINADMKRLPKTKLLGITKPDPQRYDTHTALEDMDFPTEVKIQTESYVYNKASVNWYVGQITKEIYDPDKVDDQQFTLKGNVILPEEIDKNGLSTEIEMTVIVDGLPRCDSPVCQPEGSTYYDDVTLYLYVKNEEFENNELYYSIKAVDPESGYRRNKFNNENWTLFDMANPPVLTTEDKTVTDYVVQCYTKSADTNAYRDSVVSSAHFTIDKLLIPCESLTITPDGATILPYETFKFESLALPVESTDKKVNYRSSNPDVVYVRENSGECMGVSVGSSIITAYTTRGTAEVTCVVNVLPVDHMFNSISADTWVKKSSVVLQYDIAAESNRFLQLFIDGAPVDRSCYEIDVIPLPEPEPDDEVANTSYSTQYDPKVDTKTVIRLLPAYLESLSLGDHSLYFSFNDGSATTNLNVSEIVASFGSGTDAVDSLSDNDSAIADRKSSHQDNIWVIALIILGVAALAAGGAFAAKKFLKTPKRKH